MQLSIIIPCYNESKNIPLILDRFNKVIDNKTIELIIVNNGSSDSSQKTLSQLLPQYPFAKELYIEKNQGYGYGICQGLKYAQGNFLAYTHADLQTDPADVLTAFELILQQPNPYQAFIKGNRKKRSVKDNLFTIGMSIFESLYLKTKLWDINAQPNLFHRSFFESIQSQCPNDFSLDLFFLYKAQKYKLNIIRFAVFFPPRMHGKSSWNTGLQSKWKFIKRTIEFSVKLKKQL